jgi:hypothetical protein
MSTPPRWRERESLARKAPFSLPISLRLIDSLRNPIHNPRFPGGVPEWLKGADCKSVGLRLRWFESNLLHQEQGVCVFATAVCGGCGCGEGRQASRPIVVRVCKFAGKVQ